MNRPKTRVGRVEKLGLTRPDAMLLPPEAQNNARQVRSAFLMDKRFTNSKKAPLCLISH
jgi:hypothetical protein